MGLVADQRCPDCGFSITGAHCFSYEPGTTNIASKKEPVLPERVERDPTKPLSVNNIGQRELAILADLKEQAQAKAEAKQAKKDARAQKKKQKRLRKQQKGWPEFTFLDGREPFTVKAPTIRMAQEIAIKERGPDIWPQTQFDE